MAQWVMQHMPKAGSWEITSQPHRWSRENKQDVQQGYNLSVHSVSGSSSKPALSKGSITPRIGLPTKEQVFKYLWLWGHVSFKQKMPKQVCVPNNEKHAFYHSVFQGAVCRQVAPVSFRNHLEVWNPLDMYSGQWFDKSPMWYWFTLIFGNYWWVTRRKIMRSQVWVDIKKVLI